ncbi:4Fe-4S binding protein [Leadbettera azotonutricia]|nr:4Fe-4S binding protein [Leadbettera azotonutricia]
MQFSQVSKVDTSRWIKSIQGWSWIITILWITIANIWKPFGLYGLVCMFTPIIIALSGRGKMHCARVCPRGSFIRLFTKKISLGLTRPRFMNSRAFHWVLWGMMMGTFLGLFIYTAPQGVYVLGNTILVFMEVATGLAFIFGILFTPRAWCTVCPMGFTTGNLRTLLERKGKNGKGA